MGTKKSIYFSSHCLLCSCLLGFVGANLWILVYSSEKLIYITEVSMRITCKFQTGTDRCGSFFSFARFFLPLAFSAMTPPWWNLLSDSLPRSVLECYLDNTRCDTGKGEHKIKDSIFLCILSQTFTHSLISVSMQWQSTFACTCTCTYCVRLTAEFRWCCILFMRNVFGGNILRNHWDANQLRWTV